MDADVLMNLLATGCAAEIIRALELTLLAAPTVAGELLYLESGELGGQREPIDLALLEKAGVLIKLVLEEREIDVVIELVRPGR